MGFHNPRILPIEYHPRQVAAYVYEMVSGRWTGLRRMEKTVLQQYGQRPIGEAGRCLLCSRQMNAISFSIMKYHAGFTGDSADYLLVEHRSRAISRTAARPLVSLFHKEPLEEE